MPLREPDERDDPELLDDEEDDVELRTVEPELRPADDEPLLTVAPLLRVEDPELERTELDPLEEAADLTTERIIGITRPLLEERLLLVELVAARTEDSVDLRTDSLVSSFRLLEPEDLTDPLLDELLLEPDDLTVPLLDEPVLDELPDERTVPEDEPEERVDPDERTVPLDELELDEPEDRTVPDELPDERVDPDERTVPLELPVERVGEVDRTVPALPDERVVPVERPTVPVLRL